MTSTQSGRESIGNQVRIGGALALLATARVASAGGPHVLRVDPTAPAGGNGESWAGAFRDIHDALNAARASFASDPSSPVEVRIAHGTYKPDKGTGDRRAFYDASVLVSGMTLSLVGAFAGFGAPDPDRRDLTSLPTVLSGDLLGNDVPGFVNRSDNSHSLLRGRMRWGQITLDGLEFRGADQVDAADPGVGSAVYLTGALIDGVTISTATFQDCIVEGNRVTRGNGGGVFVQAKSTVLRRTLASDNLTAFGDGGAFYCLGALTIWQCEFANNTCEGLGGGVSCEGALSVVTSRFTENHAGSGGGAIRKSGTNAQIEWCTFVRNTAGDWGGGLSADGWISVNNSILWDNQGIGSNAHVFDGDSCAFERSFLQDGPSSVQASHGVPTFANTGDVEPDFVKPAPADADPANWRRWNYRLRWTSPALNFGRIMFGSGFPDLDGNLPHSSKPNQPIDIGCYYNHIAGCLANLDRDAGSIVNDDDFVVFVGAYNLGVSPPANPGADLDRDGLVGDADFQLFATAYDTMLCP